MNQLRSWQWSIPLATALALFVLVACGQPQPSARAGEPAGTVGPAGASSSAETAAQAGGASDAEGPSGLVVAQALEKVLTDSIARCEKSVVSIARVSAADPRARETQPDFFAGRKVSPADPDPQPSTFATGVVVGPGLVLTSHHVLVAGAATDSFIITTVSKRSYSARIKGSDPRSDMAVLEVTERFPAEDFAPMPLGDGGKLSKGQFVVSIGNPFAIARDGQASASWGIIANLQCKAAPSTEDQSRSTLHHYGTMIQTDAKLSLGTSGGALLNLKGEMIGLTTTLAAVAGFEQAAGYAIPVDDVFRRVLDELKAGREPGFGLIGVHFAPDAPGLGPGVSVGRTLLGGPADRAGIIERDVLLAVNDEPVRDRDNAMLRVASLAPGTIARLDLLRKGQRIRKEVSLSKFPVQRGLIVTTPAPRWRGMVVDYSTALEESEARLAAGDMPLDACVIVREVAEASPAWEVGLRRGMLITHVGAQRLEVPAEFHKAVNGKEGNVSLKVSDGAGKTSTIVVPGKTAS